MKLDLSGRVALVTGASSGLGARFARLLAGAGARVVLAARRVDKLEGLRAAIAAAGGEAAAVAMDVAAEADVVAAYDAAERAFGTVDTVIANAGMNAEGPAVELAVREFDRLMAVNVRGVFLTAREGAKRLMAAGSRERGHGRMVLIASITASAVWPGISAYAGSKAAVVQMGRTLARDWAGRGINVNMLCPGYIETDINADWFATDAGKRQIAGFPRRRLMAEDGLDALLLYLASDASKYVTGSVFDADDGQSLK